MIQYHPSISVDCVLLGFDGAELKVLLVERKDIQEKYTRNKLPGRLIGIHEELDEAAYSVLQEMTGIKTGYLAQFKTFGSISRTAKPEDICWLENTSHVKIDRIVTVAYMLLVRMDQEIVNLSTDYNAWWCPIDQVPALAFDHNEIILEALREVRLHYRYEPSVLFELLPTRFTIHELRQLYEVILAKELDVRNFYKKIKTIPYIVALDESQSNVSHRAARYYRFDRKKYSRFMVTSKEN